MFVSADSGPDLISDIRPTAMRPEDVGAAVKAPTSQAPEVES